MIKAVFFDVDGTLISHKQGTLPEDTREALCLLKQNGILRFLATGRHLLELKELPVSDIDFDGYVLLNGQLCLDQEKKVLYENRIDEQDIARILPLFEKKELPLLFVEKDRFYINYCDEKVEQAQKAISTAVPAAAEYQGAGIYQVNVFSGEEETDSVMEKMPHCRMTRWNPYAVDIIPKDGGKLNGMKEILKHYGVSWDEVMAFGDGENDMEMLQAASVGVAMGNADEKVRLIADYVTADVDQGGIRKALEHYQILQE